MNGEPSRRHASPWVVAGKLTAVAFEFVSFIAGGVMAGWLLDSWLGSEPWLLILFTLSGTCAGFYHMIRALRVLEKNV